MLLEYIKNNYAQGEPIFLQDIYIENMSGASIRQNMKKLVEKGAIARYDQGIYFIPKPSRLKGKTNLAPDVVARYKYISRRGEIIGYYSGHTFANKLGLSTQVPVKEEMVSNNMAAIVREVEVGGRSYIVRKSSVVIDSENYKVLQLLDILKDFENYCDDEISAKGILIDYIKKSNITRDDIEKYITAFPIKVYKTIFDMRLDYVFA